MFKICPVVLFLLVSLPSTGLAHENQGYLYGRVITRSGNEYEGLLRWGNQEAFWGDFFNSAKEDLPWLEEMEDEVESGGSTIKVFGWKFKVSSSHDRGRIFMARFGDIERIEVRGDDAAVVFMKGGAEMRIEGGSDDVGHKISVQDATLGEVSLHWEKLRSIEFLPTPASVQPPGTRLYGTLHCEAGVFEGYIQWDSQECLSSDLLDGESPDGDLAIEMGRIRSIQRASRRGARVILEDGRELELRGTNDVNDENRGIFVEVEGMGRVRVYWEEFERVEFRKGAGSGPSYQEFAPLGALRGSVLVRDGSQYEGTVILDLDEEYAWEILNGERSGVDYYLPLALVQSIQPDGRDASRVELRSGESFVLKKGQDVGESNAGVVVLPQMDPDEAIYIAWKNVEEIRLDAPGP